MLDAAKPAVRWELHSGFRPRALLSVLCRREDGQAMVEFAILIIPLALILFGIVDFGRALNYYNDLTQLAGQGARAAAVNQNPNGGVAVGCCGVGSLQQQLASDADSPELKRVSNHLTVCINAVPANTGSPVTVTTSYTFHFLPLIHSAAVTLTSSQTERFEANAPSYTTGCSGP
jgi:Flp pilus assembly protein TadG